jgi:molybdopterin molybdotransferase
MADLQGPLPPGVDPCDRPAHGSGALRLDEARERIIAGITPVTDVESVGLRDALGRVLAHPVRASVDVPSHRNSAMDGYALAGAELPAAGSAAFEVLGTSWAGRPVEDRACGS